MVAATLKGLRRLLSGFTWAFTGNPILTKEMATRVRGWQSPSMLLLYPLFLGGAVLLLFRFVYGLRGPLNPEVGWAVYTVLALGQLGLLAVVVPALTSGVISGERERQTLDLLTTTQMSAFAIVIGKLMGSLAYALLLIVVSLPVFSIVLFFGGVQLTDLLALLLIYFMTAVTYGALGVFVSSWLRRTQVSAVLTYILVFLLLIGAPMLGAAIYSRQQWVHHQSGQYLGRGRTPIITHFSPIPAMLSRLPAGDALQLWGLDENRAAYAYGTVVHTTPAAAPGATPPTPGGTVGSGSSGAPSSPSAQPALPKPPDPLVAHAVFDGILVILLVAGSSLLVAPVKPWQRRNRRELRWRR